ncbi:hypothetical protein C474_12796 [Halogeometricum pallidum JCM 14848]|uniref:PGF-CTERM sorting domain-containing protein n=1 Tax=Halogeometricum pallidum JCM 14848 TaxID=1227487 RepID=M0D6Y5_HALPD|nr:PGF-CTERM sorting domain-containing protein [Halogeometricum pallidum]ELZ29914.1 hypothetical protein C474_12796 [Halogeometricum pallidum JCM 14848]
MKRTVAVFAAMLVVAAVVPASGAAAATQEQNDAYAGTHVAFDARADAVANYTVGGVTVFDSLRVESAGSGDSGGSTEGGLGTDVGASLSTAADVSGSAVSLSTSANAEAAATVTAESGATLRVHDTPNGNLVVASDDGSQVLRANVSDGATASAEGDSRVVVESENATGVFVAVGNASVTTSDDGDVVARVGEDGRIVLRAYNEGEERTESDREAEELIADGTATAELYLSGEAGEESASVVRYDGNTTVTVAERSAESATFAVERSVDEGAVVLASVSGAAANASDSLDVTVDGEAAARVESASELRTAANGGDRPAYAVADGGAEADASTDVYVALNHFSERTVTMRSAGDASSTTTAETTDDAATTETTAADGESEGETGTETASSMPGFGATATLLALAGAALIAARRR